MKHGASLGWIVVTFAAACAAPGSFVNGVDAGADTGEPGLDATADVRVDAGSSVPIDATSDASGLDAPAGALLAIEPPAIHVPAGRNQIFVASAPATWSVAEPGGGAIDETGTYTAPNTPGVYHVVATSGGLATSAAVTVEQMNLTVLTGGLGGTGNVDGVGASARFVGVADVVRTPTTLYVADYDTVRAIDIATRQVTTLAGGGGGPALDGIGTSARFHRVLALALDAAGETLYVGDGASVRTVDLATGTVTTIAGAAQAWGTTDGPGVTARFRSVHGLCLVGTTLYIADSNARTIRTLDTSVATHDVHLLAGQPDVAGFVDSTDPLQASFGSPIGLACNATTLYVADWASDAVRTVDRASGAVDTLVGGPGKAFADGGFATAGTPGPTLVSLDPARSVLYVNDFKHGVIRALDLDARVASTLVGDVALQGWHDGVGTSAQLWQASGMTSDGATLWFADRTLNVMRSIELATATVKTIAGQYAQVTAGFANGSLEDATFTFPRALVTDGADHVIVADSFAMRTISLSTGLVSLRAGEPGVRGQIDGAPAVARLDYTSGLLWDPSGPGVLWQSGDAQALRAIATDGSVTTELGALGQHGSTDGVGTAARFFGPAGLAIVGDQMIVVDLGNYTLRKIDRTTGLVTTLAGMPGVYGSVDGIGSAARFRAPYSIATDGVSKVWIGDWGDISAGATIREVDVPTGRVTTIAGDFAVHAVDDGIGTLAHFTGPYAMVYDGHGSLYIADTGGDRWGHGVAMLRRMWVPTRAVSTYAGQLGKWGPTLGPLQTASLAYPMGLALTPSGDLLFTGENAVFAIVRE